MKCGVIWGWRWGWGVDAHTQCVCVQCVSVKCTSKCLSMHLLVCVSQMCGVNKWVAPSTDMRRRFSTHNKGISGEPTCVYTHIHTHTLTMRRVRGEAESRHRLASTKLCATRGEARGARRFIYVIIIIDCSHLPHSGYVLSSRS